VVPIVLRHPALMAMEAATLDEISGGRLRLGLGVSHRLRVEGWYGLTLDDPLGRVREYVTVVREVLEKGSTAFEGRHYTARFGFMGYHPARERVPLLLAALGPRMLRLAAELADGVVLWMCDPAYIRQVVRPTLDETLAQHGRSVEDFDVVAAVPTALTEDRDAARNAFRRRAMPYTQLPFYRKAIAASGHGEDLQAIDDGKGPEGLSDGFGDTYAALGDAEAIAGKLKEYRAAGANLPSVGPLSRHEGYAGVEATLEASMGIP
jgi:alkanesulfonate monooxygenase SsuD/methylene tetrahydromethanopterin reductase-like flavin-dependent oxidoreductase (luciferase family)